MTHKYSESFLPMAYMDNVINLSNKSSVTLQKYMQLGLV